jgi:hypothetical protein
VSRLDSVIRRLETQRDCLDAALDLIGPPVGGLGGPILEIGLGNGRTYDHLRERCGGREIFVFDRRIAAHPDCLPDDAHMLLGDFAATLPGAGARIGAPAALANADIGTGNAAASRALGEQLAGWLAPLMALGGVIVADQPMAVADWRPLPLPPSVGDGRYFMYQVAG